MDGEERFATRGAAVSLLFLESEENKRTESIISESEDTDGEYCFREKVKDDEESTERPTRRSRSIKRPREDIFLSRFPLVSPKIKFSSCLQRKSTPLIPLNFPQ
jgi:hypothetical protein|mmetsp:Transcript_29819/g.53955  ORF Transcript_29819/g.53955 Transcript_29819/m.53955 type:complete len:104 (-) Transcript_29819:45-356(-)